MVNKIPFLKILLLCFSVGSHHLVAQINQPETPVFDTFQKQTTASNNNLPFTNKSFYQNQKNTTTNEKNFKKTDPIANIHKEVKSKPNYSNSKIITYQLPSYKGKGVNYYKNAFEELKAMKQTDYSTTKATFAVENAFYEETKNFDAFQQTINNISNFLKQKMDDYGYNKQSNFAKNIMIFQFFSDTLKVNKHTLHYPIAYDFDDYMGNNDWSKMFVTKLLETNKGQCNSMPRLYLLIADAMEAEAYLSLSPNHSYIKFPDDKRNWINVELTSKVFPSDALMMQFGHINAVALQNKVYMQPLNKKELLAQNMIDLALGYVQKFGYDAFVNTILNEALQLHPVNMTGIQLQSNYYTILSEYVMQQLGISEANFQEIKNHPKALALYQKRIAQYTLEDNLGYAPMPEEKYQQWLNTIREKQTLQQKQALLNSLKIKATKTID